LNARTFPAPRTEANFAKPEKPTETERMRVPARRRNSAIAAQTDSRARRESTTAPSRKPKQGDSSANNKRGKTA
jgi:hypothetical protein